MNDYFITNIEIVEHKHIQGLIIPLSTETRKHLIFTGKNGSGKTSTLKEINKLLNKLINNGFSTLQQNKKQVEAYQEGITVQNKNLENYEMQITQQKELLKKETDHQRKVQIHNSIKSYESNIKNAEAKLKQYQEAIVVHQKKVNDFSKVDLIFSNQKEIYKNIIDRKFILAYFEAKRVNIPTISDSIKKIKLTTNSTTDTKQLHKQFIEYMVKKRTDMLNDLYDGDGEKAKQIEMWFGNFEKTLKNLFNEPTLCLKYYSEELNFKVEYGGKSFGLNELSDGYSSLLAILTELILRMEAHGVKAYDMQGVVLVDEIETHLHVELQKKVLPFLVDFFPRIQFIVTTHSPFVLSSLANTVICDLEKNFITEDLTGYSYESLVDSYFDTDKYSEEVKLKLKRFKELTVLSNSKKLQDEELREYIKLEMFFDSLPKYQNEEIGYQFKKIEQLKKGSK